MPDPGNEPQLVLENRKIALDAATSVQAVVDKIVETLALGSFLAAMGRTAGALRLVDAATNAMAERVAAMPKKVRLQVAAEAAG